MKISDRPWSDVSEKDYEDADEYCRACLIDMNERGRPKRKALAKLPVKEPRKMGGALNRNAVRAAAAVLSGGRGGVDAPPGAKRKAARRLMKFYKELGEDPPESLHELAR